MKEEEIITRIRQACDAIYEKYEGNPLIEKDDILASFENIINDYYEAPEKLYFDKRDKGILDIYSNKESDNDIEYTRTNAFIEKACEWLKSHADDYSYTWYNEMEGESGITDKCIEDFRKYMEE